MFNAIIQDLFSGLGVWAVIVVGAMVVQVLAADLATIDDFQERAKQLALSAIRAAPEKSPARQAGAVAVLGVESDDFAADFARLAAAGVRFVEGPRHEAYGSVAVFEDLYGNKWDLVQYNAS